MRNSRSLIAFFSAAAACSCSRSVFWDCSSSSSCSLMWARAIFSSSARAATFCYA